jgi:hypothetical protein
MRVTGRLRTVRIHVRDSTERVHNETEDSTELLKKTDTEILQTDRIPQKEGITK